MTHTEQLIVFTRYPEPGKTKTRLIPALGPEGAAKLQRQMTQTTLAEAKHLQLQRSAQVEVYFTGASLSAMTTWLGTEFAYRPQPEGNLGQRLETAFAGAFTAGMQRVIAIGIDCPDLKAEILVQAFEHLMQKDLVLGPALDGGYYLIGLRRFVPELFQNIAWSTAAVLQQTTEIAQRLGLAIADLPPLGDIDRPEDLERLGVKNI